MEDEKTALERRNHPRIPVMMQVSFTNGEDFMVDYSTNLSSNGIFINTQQAVAGGDRVHMKFFLPGYDQPVRILGTVRWRRAAPISGSEAALSGIGVEFLEASQQNREAIRHFVERFLPEEGRTSLGEGEGWSEEDWRKINDLYGGEIL